MGGSAYAGPNPNHAWRNLISTVGGMILPRVNWLGTGWGQLVGGRLAGELVGVNWSAPTGRGQLIGGQLVDRFWANWTTAWANWTTAWVNWSIPGPG